jgi:mono/diheme cytochrome c family protein
MICKSLIYKSLISIFFFGLSFNIFAEVSPDIGKTLFRTNCATCHNKNMKSQSTGPALGGVEDRWSDYPESDLYAWIRNSQALVATGHKRANEVYAEYNKSVMTAFPNLTDDDIGSLIAYINGVYDGTYGAAAVGTVAGIVDGQTQEKGIGTWVYWLLLGVLGLFALVLTRVIGNLNFLAAEKEGKSYQRKTTLETLTSKGVVSFILFGLIVLGAYTAASNAINLGRQQGYAPEQPINFSHATHAGVNKIDCQYCHDGARRSKHAVIPATNTCINCHSAIKYGSEYGTAELTKIYASIGYLPKGAGEYIPNYDKLSLEEKKEIYTGWMLENTIENDDKFEKVTEDLLEEIDNQWDNIVVSLTSEQRAKINGEANIEGPIEWVRVHNLPDHVYFNHAQHVTVGGLDCQTCHGKVEEMDVVAQYSPLSMGWCINCHRETKVQFADNDYYKSYAKYHDEIAAGAREGVTVEDIGGLECQKCHY